MSRLTSGLTLSQAFQEPKPLRNFITTMLSISRGFHMQTTLWMRLKILAENNVYLSVRLSVRLSVCQAVGLSVCRSGCLSILKFIPHMQFVITEKQESIKLLCHRDVRNVTAVTTTATKH